jgi:VWFA-related protein
MGQLAHIAEQSNLGSEFFLLTFSGAPRIVTDWTFDKKALAQAISTLGDQESKGRNALYDACILAIKKRRQMDRKNFILLIADGHDGGSKADFNQLRTTLRSSLTTVYCIPLIDPYDSQGGLWMSTLEQIAFPSGGELLFPSDQRQVADAIDRIAIWMKHAYQIGLRKDDLPRDGKYHKLSVKAAHIGEKDGNRRTFVVAAPQGFLAEH